MVHVERTCNFCGYPSLLSDRTQTLASVQFLGFPAVTQNFLWVMLFCGFQFPRSCWGCDFDAPPPYTESSFRTWISILEDVSLYIHVVSKNNSLALGLKTNEFTDALGVIKQSKAFFFTSASFLADVHVYIKHRLLMFVHWYSEDILVTLFKHTCPNLLDIRIIRLNKFQHIPGRLAKGFDYTKLTLSYFLFKSRFV